MEDAGRRVRFPSTLAEKEQMDAAGRRHVAGWGGSAGLWMLAPGDFVASYEGEMVDERAEAVPDLAVGECWEALRWAAGDRLVGGDGVVVAGWVLVGGAQRRPGLAQVPDELGGQHGHRQMALTRSGGVVDGADVQVHGLLAAEVTLDAGQPPVGGGYAGPSRLLWPRWRAALGAVQGGLRADRAWSWV